jgi:hypothetical protein
MRFANILPVFLCLQKYKNNPDPKETTVLHNILKRMPYEKVSMYYCNHQSGDQFLYNSKTSDFLCQR